VCMCRQAILSSQLLFRFSLPPATHEELTHVAHDEERGREERTVAEEEEGETSFPIERLVVFVSLGEFVCVAHKWVKWHDDVDGGWRSWEDALMDIALLALEYSRTRAFSRRRNDLRPISRSTEFGRLIRLSFHRSFFRLIFP